MPLLRRIRRSFRSDNTGFNREKQRIMRILCNEGGALNMVELASATALPLRDLSIYLASLKRQGRITVSDNTECGIVRRRRRWIF